MNKEDIERIINRMIGTYIDEEEYEIIDPLECHYRVCTLRALLEEINE